MTANFDENFYKLGIIMITNSFVIIIFLIKKIIDQHNALVFF